jgi:hypothetical protein
MVFGSRYYPYPREKITGTARLTPRRNRAINYGMTEGHRKITNWNDWQNLFQNMR